jgi:hypothetical protein
MARVSEAVHEDGREAAYAGRRDRRGGGWRLLSGTGSGLPAWSRRRAGRVLDPVPAAGRPAAERRVLAPSAGPDGALRDDGPPDDGPRPGPDGDGWQVERRGFQIVRELQARALAERGYTLSPDELVTTLGATTTLPSDVIARLAQADGEDRIAAGAERARAGHLDSASAVPPLGSDVAHGDQLTAASQDELNADTARAHAFGDRAAVQLAAESFPYSITDAVTAAAGARHGSATRAMTNPNIHRPGRSA